MDDELLKRSLEYAKETNRPEMRKLLMRFEHQADQEQAAFDEGNEKLWYELMNEKMKLINEIITRETKYLNGANE